MSRNYLEAFVILAAAFALGFFLVLPKYQEVQVVKGQCEEKIIEIQKRKQYYSALEAIDGQLAQYEDAYKKVATALPDNPDTPALMSFVQSAAMQSGLAVKSIAYSGDSKSVLPFSQTSQPPAANNSMLQKYEIAIELAGSYESLKNFLSIIEHSSRLIAVRSLDIASSQDDDSEETKSEIQPFAANGGDIANANDKIMDYVIKLSAHYYE